MYSSAGRPVSIIPSPSSRVGRPARAPVAEAALDYGATSWAFLRSKDDPNDFVQMASWRSKLDFDRYWYSEDVAERRAEAMGL